MISAACRPCTHPCHKNREKRNTWPSPNHIHQRIKALSGSHTHPAAPSRTVAVTHTVIVTRACRESEAHSHHITRGDCGTCAVSAQQLPSLMHALAADLVDELILKVRISMLGALRFVSAIVGKRATADSGDAEHCCCSCLTICWRQARNSRGPNIKFTLCSSL